LAAGVRTLVNRQPISAHFHYNCSTSNKSLFPLFETTLS
jgi:hypothetical protein